MYEKTMSDPRDTIITINYANGLITNPLSYGALTVYEQQSIFSTPADLIVMPKSKQHAAKFGNYSVSTETGVTNARGTDRSLALSVLDGSGGTFDSVITWNIPLGYPHTPPSVVDTNAPFISPFNVNGAYYTGLSSDTTLVVTAIWHVETNPATADARIMSLAHPSPPLDNCAMEVYAFIAYHLPAGVSVKDNAAGDWIQTIASLAQEAGLPGAGILKMGGTLVNAVQKFYKSDFGKMTKAGNNPSGRDKRPKLKTTKQLQGAPKQLIMPKVYTVPPRRIKKNVVVVQKKKKGRQRARSVDVVIRQRK